MICMVVATYVWSNEHFSWNVTNVDTMHWTKRKCVLIREVSLFQRLMICTQEYAIGSSETVLIREVSLFQRLMICTQEYAIGSSEH